MTLAEGGKSKKRTEDRNKHNGNGQREEYVEFRNFFISRKELWCTPKEYFSLLAAKRLSNGVVQQGQTWSLHWDFTCKKVWGILGECAREMGKADGINRCFLTCRESLQLPPFCVRLHCRLQLQKLCSPGISAFWVGRDSFFHLKWHVLLSLVSS